MTTNSNVALSELDNSGNVLSGAAGYSTGVPGPDYGLVGVGIDSNGNVWMGNGNNQSMMEFNSSGALISGSSGYSTPGVYPIGAAFDAAGNVWVNSLNIGVVGKLSATGALLAPSGGYPNCTDPGLIDNYMYLRQCLFWIPVPLAVDGAGNVWTDSAIETSENGRVPDSMFAFGVAELSNTGAILSGPTAYTGGYAVAIGGVAIDGSGNVWVMESAGYMVEYVGAATPVVTPFSLGVKNRTLGQLP
jgi:hypothetical protein